jgi:two-component system KDP operon response regulator KdpE
VTEVAAPGPAEGPRVLVVDDDASLRRTLALNLRARGYTADLAGTGEAALRMAASHHPDVVILDLGLPGMDGLDVIAGIRGWSSVPIVVLSGRDTESMKVQALDLGADDYLTKPFGMDELFARIRAATRRAVVPEGDPVVTTPDFTIDFAAKRVLRDGEVVRLTPRQWRIVEVLVRNRGRLVTYSELLHDVWGPGYGTETNYLRVFMTHIRQRLEPEPSHPRYFITEPGMGYRFQLTDASTASSVSAD